MSPQKAALLFAVSLGVALLSLRGSLGGAAGDGATTSATTEDFDPESASATTQGDAPACDLLAEHGSWNGEGLVRMAFTAPLDASISPMPAGETNPAAGRWSGGDPPALEVGVLMVGENVRRAVVQGVVVGLGDRIAEAEVISIEPGVLGVIWSGRRLTYDLESNQAREFRGELSRRAAAATADAANGDANNTLQDPK